MSTGALFSKVLLTLKTNSQRTAQVFFNPVLRRTRYRVDFFEAKRKKLSFFFWLDDQAPPSLQPSSWSGAVPHESPQVGGEGNSPPRATTQNGAPPGTSQERPGTDSLPLTSLMSLNPHGEPPRASESVQRGNI